MSRNIVFSSCKRIIRLLPDTKYNKLIKILGILFTNSVIDVFGLALLVPILSVMLDENLVTENVYFAYLYEHIGFSSYRSFILVFCGAIIIITLVKSVANLWLTHQQVKNTYNFFEYFTNNVLKYYFHKDFNFFKNTNSSIIVRNIHAASEQIVSGVLIPTANLVNELIIALIIIVGIINFNSSAVLLLLLIVAPISFMFYQFAKNRIEQIGKQINELYAKVGKTLYQTVFGYIDIKINNREDVFFDTYKNYIQLYIEQITKGFMYRASPMRIIEMSMVMAVTTVVIYGTFFIADKESLSVLLSVLAVGAYRLLPSVNRIMLAVLTIKQNQHCINIVEEALSTSAAYLKQSDKVIEFEKCIKLENITFSYPNEQGFALQDISFTIKKGERIGIVGHSGSGKTTLTNILLRFLKEEKGSIWVDDTKLLDKHVKSWRDLLGYVQQDVFLIDGTIKENVAFGISPLAIDEERIRKVLWQASLSDFVSSLSDGIDTLIGERGTLLSGGQKQRLAIARVLYSDAKILFFDEATSALDSKTEKEITEAIRKLSDTHFTMCIIAHRITTLKYCDKIIKMTDGKIETICTYEKLLKEELVI